MTKLLLIPTIALLLTSCGDKAKPNNNDNSSTDSAKNTEAKVVVSETHLSLLKPLPAAMESESNPLTEDKINLGRMLYFDKRFSKNHDISCNSCHGLETFGVDNKQFSPGHKKQLGGRNSPSVYNAALHIAQFWDGRAADVEEQAKGPVLNPVEMAMPDDATVLKVINSIPEYVAAFKKAFPGDNPVTYDNFGKAIGAFERKLVTPSKFDKFLSGDSSALNNAEKAGLNKFMEIGCFSCHNGPALGGNMYQKLGLIKAWPDLKDIGRSEVTKNDAEKYFFKVPSLRNIEKTGPYLHDGSVTDLNEMVAKMAEYQLARELTEEDVTSIVTFLKTLTGTPDADYIKEPKLPASTDSTPKPDAN